MAKIKWFLLQLFADGASGGDGGGEGAAAGETAADAGQQRLKELGVPESKIRKNRAYKFGKPAAEAVRKAEPQEKPQQEAAAPAEQKDSQQEAQSTHRMSWDEIVKDPEYNQELQKLIKARLRESGAYKDAMEALDPALELLARQYGIDPEKKDYKALAQKITDDNHYYETKAMETGDSVETVKKLEQQEAELNRFRRQEAQNLETQKINRHFASLEQQGDALKARFPGFDLRAELQNPVFARMTAPDSGLSVEDAYYAVHRAEIQSAQAKVIADQTAKQMANSIRSNAARPDESGSRQGSSTVSFDYSKASRAQREELKRRIRSGERILPGREFG